MNEGDGSWFRIAGSGRETLRQRLSRTITESTSIDTMAGTEHIKWVEPETFPGSIAHYTVKKEEKTKAV